MNNFKRITVPVPNNCTDQLQPIDLSVNKTLKNQFRQSFTGWYAEQVKKQIENGVPVEEVKTDLRLLVLKELEAKWMLSAYDYLKFRRCIVENGFKKAGIMEAVEGQLPMAESEEDLFEHLDSD